MRIDPGNLLAGLAPVRAAYFKTLELLRLDQIFTRRIRTEALTLILNLHRVSPHPSPFWPPLLPEMFDKLLDFLSSNFDVVTLSDLPRTDPRKAAVVLSFDDGYRDFVDFAAPILAARGLRANLNIIPECVETGLPIWNVRLYDGLFAASSSLFRELRVEGFSHSAVDDSPRGKARYGAQLAAHLKNRPRMERMPLWRQVDNWLRRVEVAQPTAMMSIEDVRSVAGAHEVGVHSYSHESMAFEDDTFFREDVRMCRAFFKDRLELPLTIYAFPNGSYRPSQVDHLIASDFEHILLVDEKLSRTRGKVLPRVSINAATLPELKLQALGYRGQGVA